MKLKNLIALYHASPEWGRLAVNSRRAYEGGIQHLEHWFDRDANKITRSDVIDLRDALYHKRGMCRITMMVLNNVFRYGYDRGIITYNHAVNVGNLPAQIPWKRWDMADVKRVLEVVPKHVRHAILMALYTGQRRSDLTGMKWSQYDGTYIHIIQKKTKKPVSIPVHPVLKEEIEIMREGNKKKSPYILNNSLGEKWSDDNLTRVISDWSKSVGLEGTVLHGLRKTTASILAELGCTPHEIAAITGQSLKEVMRYTQEADQKTLAKKAIDRWSQQQ